MSIVRELTYQPKISIGFHSVFVVVYNTIIVYPGDEQESPEFSCPICNDKCLKWEEKLLSPASSMALSPMTVECREKEKKKKKLPLMQSRVIQYYNGILWPVQDRENLRQKEGKGEWGRD